LALLGQEQTEQDVFFLALVLSLASLAALLAVLEQAQALAQLECEVLAFFLGLVFYLAQRLVLFFREELAEAVLFV
jgi:hypothetical protein